MIAAPGAADSSSGAEKVLLGRLRAVNERLMVTSLRSQAAAEGTERLLAELAQVASLDELTQLPTRTVLFDRFTQSSAGALGGTQRVAIVFVDIDNFGRVNDSFGNAIGDDALKVIAQRLVQCIGRGDTVCRHGGDEFVILLTEPSSGERLAAITAAILAALSEPMTLQGNHVTVSASVGVSICPADGRDLLHLIKQADAAMYRGKHGGPGSVSYHESAPAAGASLGDAAAPASHARAGIDAVAHETDHTNSALRDANEQLVIATLNAHLKIEDAANIQRRQTDFLALLAHELRNPLAPMRSVAAILPLVFPGNKALTRLQSVLERQVKQLSRLIDDLLDMSRNTTGKLHLTMSDVDMADVVSDAETVCSSALSARRQTFVVEIPAGRLLVFGDAGRLTQVVTNLIDNASKYTEDDGSIILTITIDPEWLTLVVSDNGIGIGAESLPHIFDLFVQDPAAIRVDRTGLGIGLAVVRDLVVAHGGKVAATSQGVGKGSQFIVTLPLAMQN